MKRIILVILASITLVLTAYPRQPKDVENVLKNLDSMIESSHKYSNARLNRVDSLREITRRTGATPADLQQLGDAFIGVNSDSALFYYEATRNMAIALRDTILAQKAAIAYARQLTTTALFHEAYKILENINPKQLDKRGLLSLYDVKAQLFIDAARIYKRPSRHKELVDSAILYLDSISAYLPDKSAGHKLVDAQILLLKGNNTMAIGELNEITDSLSTDSPIYATAAGMLADMMSKRPAHKNDYIYYLASSAIADIRQGNKEMESLGRLGKEMYESGDYARAYSYLTTAGKAIADSESRKMLADITPNLVTLAETMQIQQNRQRNTLIIIISLLLAIIATLIFIAFRNRRNSEQSTESNKTLKDALSARELYIRQLLELCATYIDGIEDFNKLVGRKLKAKQTQDLYSIIESGKILQEQTERFFVTFDKAILQIFPNFIEDVNKLLLEDKQLPATTGNRLSPELRILAFLRLGVTDSARIAKFLGLSLNTVYTYRNRVKNRAIDRANFETAVLSIGTQPDDIEPVLYD